MTMLKLPSANVRNWNQASQIQASVHHINFHKLE